MKFHFKKFAQLLIAGSLLFSSELFADSPSDSIYLYTPLTNISVSPGQTISYEVEAINNSYKVQRFALAVSGLGNGWNHSLQSGGWKVSEISVLPKDRKSFTLQVNVPLKVNKGTYKFAIQARGLCSLPLVAQIKTQGTYKTLLTTDQSNMEGTSKTTFTFQANLQNLTADSLLYALHARVNAGWKVEFKANYKQVSAVNVGANKSQSIGIEITAPDEVAAGTYTVPILAQAGNTQATLDLSVVITGSYQMLLTTPTGLLSTKITAGSTKKVELLIQNTGSSPLLKVKPESTTPANWEVSFEPKEISEILPGASQTFFATIKADKKAIPGDYQVVIKASNDQTNASVTLRASVETSLLWGWIGVLVIGLAVALVVYLFRKFGRR